MAYTYEFPLNAQFQIAAANFASQAALLIPSKVTALQPVGGAKRVLTWSQIVGVLGVIGTAGTGTISIGDGTTAARYGTFVLDSGLTAGQSITGSLTLTEDGSHVGASDNNPVPVAVTLTFAGTAIINQLTVVAGYF